MTSVKRKFIYRKLFALFPLICALVLLISLRQLLKWKVKESDVDAENLIQVKSNQSEYLKKKLAVIVPISENCYDEIFVFAPHMIKFLNSQKILFHIFVVQQVDKLRFNRAALLNIGYLYTKDNFNYTVLHDIDLLPLNPKLSYAFPGNAVFHPADIGFHPTIRTVSKVMRFLQVPVNFVLYNFFNFFFLLNFFF
jgi:N-terminal region of glycosyl transferase group 7